MGLYGVGHDSGVIGGVNWVVGRLIGSLGELVG